MQFEEGKQQDGKWILQAASDTNIYTNDILYSKTPQSGVVTSRGKAAKLSQFYHTASGGTIAENSVSNSSMATIHHNPVELELKDNAALTSSHTNLLSRARKISTLPVDDTASPIGMNVVRRLHQNSFLNQSPAKEAKYSGSPPSRRQ